MKIHGDLVLAGSAAKKYFEAFELLCSVALPSRIISRDSFDEIVCESLHLCLKDDSEAALIAAVAGLEAKLSQTTIAFDVSLAVFGLASDCAGITFGEVRFRSQRLNTARTSVPPELSGDVLFAEMSVKAIDRSSAVTFAQKAIDRHLAVLNAICSDYPPSYTRFSRTQESNFAYAVEETGSGRNDHQITISCRTLARLYSRAELSTLIEKHGGNLLSSLLVSETSNAQRIISAFETAGFACLERQPHIAFLLFAIALESAVLGKQNKEELTMQLALRAAHLLSSSMEGRRQEFSRIKTLYRVRSKVVHTGSRNVNEKDLVQMKYVCLSCLYSLLAYEKICHFTDEEQLEAWFSEQMLESKTMIGEHE